MRRCSAAPQPGKGLHASMGTASRLSSIKRPSNNGAPVTEPEMIEWIDNASLEDLLRKNRFSPIGDPFFRNEVGDHFMGVLAQRRNEDPSEWTRVSKKVGW